MIVSNKGRYQNVGIYHSIYHTAFCFLRRSSLAARISALISSNESSCSALFSAALRCCMNKSRALGASVLLPLMANGMLRLLITAFTKMLNAVFALIPNCSQSSSNCDFKSESILTVTADCAIIKYFNYDGIMPPFRWQSYNYSLKLTNNLGIICICDLKYFHFRVGLDVFEKVRKMQKNGLKYIFRPNCLIYNHLQIFCEISVKSFLDVNAYLLVIMSIFATYLQTIINQNIEPLMVSLQ